MLAYLTIYLLHNPVRVLIGVLLSALAGGGIGWGTFRREIAAAWTRACAREASGRRHVYRDPLRTDSILRPPLVVIAAAIVGYALWIGHAGWLVVAVDAALLGRFGRALLALGLFGVGARMAYRTHRIVMGGPAPPPELQRRAVADGACGLAVNGAIVAFVAALMMGAFDQHAIEVHGIKGTTGQMTLGEIRELFPQVPVLLSAGGHPLLVWGLLGCGRSHTPWAPSCMPVCCSSSCGRRAARPRKGRPVRPRDCPGPGASGGCFRARGRCCSSSEVACS